MVDQKVLGEFVDAIKQEPEKKANTYKATVSRIDDEGVVWVYMSGSDKDTPTASTDAEVKRGDAVTVEWRNNKLYIAGNTSTPAVGTQRVAEVEKLAEMANSIAKIAEKLSIDASDYLTAHLYLDREGLWIVPASSGHKVLIATGNGTTYTTAGTYVIDSNDDAVASFTSAGVSIGAAVGQSLKQTSSALQFALDGYITGAIEVGSGTVVLTNTVTNESLSIGSAGIEIGNSQLFGIKVFTGDLTVRGDEDHGNIFTSLETYASSGTLDGDLYAAILALGWQNDVITGDEYTLVDSAGNTIVDSAGNEVAMTA